MTVVSTRRRAPHCAPPPGHCSPLCSLLALAIAALLVGSLSLAAATTTTHDRYICARVCIMCTGKVAAANTTRPLIQLRCCCCLSCSAAVPLLLHAHSPLPVVNVHALLILYSGRSVVAPACRARRVARVRASRRTETLPHERAVRVAGVHCRSHVRGGSSCCRRGGRVHLGVGAVCRRAGALRPQGASRVAW